MENVAPSVHRRCHLVLTHLVHLSLQAPREILVHLGLLEVMDNLVNLVSLVNEDHLVTLECV